MSEIYDICEVRDYKEEDKAFVMATFLRGLYYGDSWFSLIPKDIFMAGYKNIAESLIANPKNVVKVACLKEDQDVILGYSILSADFQTLHWVFVKSAFRKQGIARMILPQYPSVITHLSTLGKNLMHKFKGVIFNPFAL